jgi:hypothetical protein
MREPLVFDRIQALFESMINLFSIAFVFELHLYYLKKRNVLVQLEIKTNDPQMEVHIMKRVRVKYSVLVTLSLLVALVISPVSLTVARAQQCVYDGSDNSYCRQGDSPCAWCWDGPGGLVGCDEADMEANGSCNGCHCYF